MLKAFNIHRETGTDLKRKTLRGTESTETWKGTIIQHAYSKILLLIGGDIPKIISHKEFWACCIFRCRLDVLTAAQMSWNYLKKMMPNAA
jgi:hypothetical protein